MYLLKKYKRSIFSSLGLLLLLAGSLVTIRTFAVHADTSTIIPLNHGGAKQTAHTTNYAAQDTNPPSTTIDWSASYGLPTVHNQAGGSGTFDDPITVAIDSKLGPNGDVPRGPYQIGEKFYLPRLHLYFVAEDSCNVDIAYDICTENNTDKDDGTQLHMDLYNGDTDNKSGILACELSYGGTTDVIANAGDGYPMPDGYPNGTTLFDNASGKCVGAELWEQYKDWTVGNATTGPDEPDASPTPTPQSNLVVTGGTQDIDDSVQGSGANQFNYVGSGWGHCQDCDDNNEGFYQASHSWDKTAGDYVTITFTGTQIKFYAIVGPDHGIANFSVDGGEDTPEDTYLNDRIGNRLIYTSPTLDAGQHTLKVTITGQKSADADDSYINPDRVEITQGTQGSPNPNPTPSTSISVDDSVQGSGSNQFNYVGSGWGHCQDCDDNNEGFYQGSHSWDKTADDYVTITFTGTQIKFYAIRGPDHGLANFSLDGGEDQQGDTYLREKVGNSLVYASPVLDAGQHTLKVTVTGEKSAGADNSYINPDRVEIFSGTPTNADTNTNQPVVNLAIPPNNANTSANTSDPTDSDSSWTSIWKDDFNGPNIDTSKWTVQDYPAGFVNNELECYKNDGTHARIDGSGTADSHLVLQADKGSGACPYISGRLDTSGKFAVPPPTSAKPVRVEANLQLPAGGNGTWPAFWLLGQNIDTVGWPNCGEIDIMENAGLRSMSAATNQSTVHGLNNKSDGGRYTLNDGTLSDGYHLFRMDWYIDRMVFSIDGNEYKTVYTASLGGDQVFNQPFFILLNFAVGGDWPGSPDGNTHFPQQMNVQYVHVYQHS